MRDDLRRSCHEIWVIDCSPEGHQPDVPTRIFQGVQQPICILIAARGADKNEDIPAHVHFHSLAPGKRADKFGSLLELSLDATVWAKCPSDWRAPFRPQAVGEWSQFPKLGDFFDADF